MHLNDCREFLSRYAAAESYAPHSGPLKDGVAPPSSVRDHQRIVGWPTDGHVIPRNEYKHRLFDVDPVGDEVYTEEVLHILEAEWDTAVGKYGLDGVSEYIPFHSDEASYGIYIPQRCIRHLGYLLDGWAREIFDKPQTPVEHIHLDATSNSRPPSPFDSLNQAFDLAEELLVRYRWIDHQIELLAAHLADLTGTVAYDTYYRQHRRLNTDAIDSRYRLMRQLDSSTACRRLAPAGLYDPLLRRMTAAFTTSNNITRLNGDSPQDLRRQEVHALSAVFGVGSTNSKGFLADEIPFRRLDRSVPTRIAVYITRRESDSDSATITNRPGVHSLDPDQRPINRTDDFERSYRKADGTLKRDVDNTIEDIRTKFDQQSWKGMSIGPKNMRYIDITDSKRLIVQINKETKEVKLMDFGPHDLPRSYGFNKT